MANNNLEKQEIRDVKQKLNDETSIVVEAEDVAILNEFQEIGINIKALQEQQSLLKQDVIDILEDYNLPRFESDKGLISYKKASVRGSIDAKKLREDLPDIAKKYTKTSTVSASVSFKAK